MKKRPPAVAGLFYPGEPGQLRQMVDRLLAEAGASETKVPSTPDSAQVTGDLRAVIVPHAGYIYSGSTAALAYAQLKTIADQVKHVVIVGPAHRVGIRAVALPDVDALSTPLGDVPLWPDGAKAALAQPGVQISATVHAQEHSVEVQLPFLQAVVPDADILPLVAGWITPEVVAGVLEAVWALPGVFTVISSDLSHYHPYTQAQRLDRATVGQIRDLDATIDHDQACGATGVDAILLQARSHGLRPQVFGLCNSGDTAGDKAAVVGYAAVGFYGGVRP